MQGDMLVVMVVPPADSPRSATMTIGYDGEGEHVAYDLSPSDEQALALFVKGKVSGSCGPSYF